MSLRAVSGGRPSVPALPCWTQGRTNTSFSPTLTAVECRQDHNGLGAGHLHQVSIIPRSSRTNRPEGPHAGPPSISLSSLRDDLDCSAFSGLQRRSAPTGAGEDSTRPGRHRGLHRISTVPVSDPDHVCGLVEGNWYPPGVWRLAMAVTRTYWVSGLTCGACLALVLDAVRSLSGVGPVGVDLVRGGGSRLVMTATREHPVEATRATVELGVSLWSSLWESGPGPARRQQAPSTLSRPWLFTSLPPWVGCEGEAGAGVRRPSRK